MGRRNVGKQEGGAEKEEGLAEAVREDSQGAGQGARRHLGHLLGQGVPARHSAEDPRGAPRGHRLMLDKLDEPNPDMSHSLREFKRIMDELTDGGV
jgi:hypothetical protein